MPILRVRDAMHLVVREPVMVREEASIFETVERMIDRPLARTAFVVDDQGKLVGMVTLRDLVNHVFEGRYFESKKRGRQMFESIVQTSAMDLAEADPVCVTTDEPLEEAVKKILAHHLEEIPVVDEEGTVIGDLNLLELLSIWLEDSQREKKPGKLSSVRLTHFLYDDLICLRLKAREKRAALEELFGVLAQSPLMPHLEEFRQVVLDREILVSTGVGQGIAIPHGRCSCVHDCIIAVGLSKEGIEFNALDDRPVHVIFMIAAPDSAGFPYARFLARVIQFLSADGIQERMLACKTPRQLIGIVGEFDRELEKECEVA